jgi:dTDP-4-amino-4,6-dideoxygalactose transaminase
VHYPTPVHLLAAWADLGYRVGSFPHAERAAREVLSLPVHPELSAAQVDAVAAAIRTISTMPDRVVRRPTLAVTHASGVAL